MLTIHEGWDLKGDPLPDATHHDRRAFMHQRPVGPGELLGQMQGGAFVEIDTQQQDLGIALVKRPQRGGHAQGRGQLMPAGDVGGERP
ncbi:hypothetical protein D3C72_2019310 [compost metagenome]